IPIGTYKFKNGINGSVQWGYGSYPNNIGTVMNNWGNRFDGPAYVLGASANGPTVRLASVTDGLSNTAMWSEWIRGKNGTATLGLSQVYLASQAATGTKIVPLQTYLNSCKNSKTIYQKNGVVWDHKGQKWFNQACSEGGGYSHIMTPNLNACEFQNTG